MTIRWPLNSVKDDGHTESSSMSQFLTGGEKVREGSKVMIIAMVTVGIVAIVAIVFGRGLEVSGPAFAGEVLPASQADADELKSDSPSRVYRHRASLERLAY